MSFMGTGSFTLSDAPVASVVLRPTFAGLDAKMAVQFRPNQVVLQLGVLQASALLDTMNPGQVNEHAISGRLLSSMQANSPTSILHLPLLTLPLLRWPRCPIMM